jgi:hypothetical protein
MGSSGKTGLGGLLDYIAECIRRKMVIVCVTDMAGMQQLTEKILRKVTVNNDLLIMNIEDAYMYGYDVYDVERMRYEDEYTAHREKLYQAEWQERKTRIENLERMYRRYGISMVSISREADIIDKVVELFERHRHENIG